MKRWKELVVGYALGTLTHQDHRELLQLTVDNPQLMVDAVRLKHMSSMQIAQRVDWPTEGFEVGAEGWADTATRSLRLVLPEPVVSELNRAVSPTAKSGLSDGSSSSLSDRENHLVDHHLLLDHHVVDRSVSTDRSINRSVEQIEPSRASRVPLNRIREFLAHRRLFSRKGTWRWIIVLGLITLGIDYWRVRRLLAITQSEILQLEMRVD